MDSNKKIQIEDLKLLAKTYAKNFIKFEKKRNILRI